MIGDLDADRQPAVALCEPMARRGVRKINGGGPASPIDLRLPRRMEGSEPEPFRL